MASSRRNGGGIDIGGGHKGDSEASPASPPDQRRFGCTWPDAALSIRLPFAATSETTCSRHNLNIKIISFTLHIYIMALTRAREARKLAASSFTAAFAFTLILLSSG